MFHFAKKIFGDTGISLEKVHHLIYFKNIHKMK